MMSPAHTRHVFHSASQNLLITACTNFFLGVYFSWFIVFFPAFCASVCLCCYCFFLLLFLLGLLFSFFVCSPSFVCFTLISSVCLVWGSVSSSLSPRVLSVHPFCLPVCVSCAPFSLCLLSFVGPLCSRGFTVLLVSLPLLFCVCVPKLCDKGSRCYHTRHFFTAD